MLARSRPRERGGRVDRGEGDRIRGVETPDLPPSGRSDLRELDGG